MIKKILRNYGNLKNHYGKYGKRLKRLEEGTQVYKIENYKNKT